MNGRLVSGRQSSSILDLVGRLPRELQFQVFRFYRNGVRRRSAQRRAPHLSAIRNAARAFSMRRRLRVSNRNVLAPLNALFRASRARARPPVIRRISRRS